MAIPGISFTDPFQPQQQQQGAPGTAGASPFQSAVQLLSLRLPRFAGVQAGALAPGALLQGRGAGGLTPQQLAMLMQQRFPGIGMPFQGATPTPNITPGAGVPQGPVSGPYLPPLPPGPLPPGRGGPVAGPPQMPDPNTPLDEHTGRRLGTGGVYRPPTGGGLGMMDLMGSRQRSY